MTAKEFLERAYRIEEQIRLKQEQIGRLKALALKVTGRPKEVCVMEGQKGGTEEIILKIIGLELLLNKEIDRLVDAKREIIKALSGMGDTDGRLILEYRYVNYHPWEEIAEAMHYTLRWVHKLHVRALSELERILEGSRREEEAMRGGAGARPKAPGGTRP